MVVARLALAITVLFALSGCVTSGQEPSAEDVIQVLEDNGVEFSKPVTPTSTLHSLGNLSTNVTGLNLTLAITADGNGTLPFTVAWGDNTTSAGTLSPAAVVDQNVTPLGKVYVATLNHTFNATGLYNLTVTVTGGNTTLNQTAAVAVGLVEETIIAFTPIDLTKEWTASFTGAVEFGFGCFEDGVDCAIFDIPAAASGRSFAFEFASTVPAAVYFVDVYIDGSYDTTMIVEPGSSSLADVVPDGTSSLQVYAAGGLLNSAHLVIP